MWCRFLLFPVLPLALATPDKPGAASGFCPAQENCAQNACEDGVAAPFAWPTFIDPPPVVAIRHCLDGALEERSDHRFVINAEYRRWSNQKLGRRAFCHALPTPIFAVRRETNWVLTAGFGLHVAVWSVSAHTPPLITRAWQEVNSDSQINFFFVGSPSQCAAIMS